MKRHIFTLIGAGTSTVVLPGCYDGASPQEVTSPASTDGASSASSSATSVEDTGTSGSGGLDSSTATTSGSGSIDTGSEVRVDEFLPGKDLFFRSPEGWLRSDRERAVAVASFAPPHTSGSGGPVGGQIINLLAYIPSLEISTEEETSFGNGAWRRNSRPAVGNSVVFFVNHDLNIGVVGEQTDGEPLDTALIEGVVNSVALVTRQNTAWSKSFRSSPSKVLTLPFEDDQVYLVQGWKYNWDPNKNHGGIDYKKGKPGEWLAFDVVAAYDGGLHCEWDNSYGNVCYVKHGAEQSVFYTVYAHLESTVKSSGDVKQGEKIGVAGKTGADSNDLLHLHFEIQVDEPCNQMFCRTDPYAIDKTFDYYPGGAKFSGLGAGHWWVKDPPILPGPQMGCTQEVAHDCRDQGLSGLCVGSDIPNTFECVGDFNGGSDKDDVVLVVTGEEQSDAGLFQNETDGDLFLVKHDTKEFLFTATPDFWEDIQLEIYDNEGNFEGLVDVFGVGEKEGFIWDSKGVSGVVFVVVRNGGTPVGNYTYTWGSM